MFAHMKESDYMTKPTFLKNFWEGFKEVLGPGHVIKSLDKCDFTPMFDQFKAAWEKKKAEPKEVRWGEGREPVGKIGVGGCGCGRPVDVASLNACTSDNTTAPCIHD